MFCEQCGNPVGDSEKFCSRCGAPILPLEPEKAEAAGQPVMSAIPTKPEPPVAPAIPEEPAGGSGKKNGKKSGKKAVFFALGGVVLALAAVCVVNAGKIADFFGRSFSSPEKYYRQVEEETVAQLAEQCSTYYGMLVESPFGLAESSVNTEFTVELGEGGKNFMNLLDLSGVDLSWLSDLKMGVGFSWKESMLSYALSCGLNKTDLLSVNMLMDVLAGEIYLQVPELNEKYVGLEGYDAELYGADELELYQEMQERSAKMLEAMPEAEEVEKLLVKYMKLALDSVDDVNRKQKTLEAGGVSEKCTELEVTIDGKCLADMMESVLTEMLKDKELKKLIINTVDSMAALDDDLLDEVGSGEEAYEEFTDELEEMLEDVDELKNLDGELIMKVYVGSKGRIVGRTLEAAESDGAGTICFLLPESGKNAGCEVSVTTDDGSRIVLTGSGKKAGDKLTGSYQLEYDDTSLVEINVSGLDLEQLKQGYLNGTFTLAPSKMLGTLLTGSISGYGSLYATMLADMELKLDSQMSKNSGKVTLGLLYDEEEIVNLTASVDVGKGPGTDIPDAGSLIMLEDDEDLAAWLEGIDWDKFLGSLEKAGVPEDIMEELRDSIDLLTNGNYIYNGVYGLEEVPMDPYDPDSYDEPDGEDEYGDNEDDFGFGYGGSEDSDNNQAAEAGSLAAVLQSEDWQNELGGWNESVAELGIVLDTVAEGNTLVFVYYLPDDAAFNETVCRTMSDAFLGALEDADFISAFYTGYGVSLDAVRCTFVGADGNEIYRDEID